MGRRKAKGFNTPFNDLSLPEPVPDPEPPEPEPADTEPKGEAELFAAAMAGAEPISDPRGRVEPAKQEASALPDDEQLALLELQDLVDGKGSFELSEAEEDLAGRAAGVSREILERLRAGQFSYRHHIDLHGLSQEEARVEVRRFVAHSRRAGERCVLIVTGRGRSSPQGIPVLRQALPRWLSRAPASAHVLAFCSALGVDGGPGAFYVLLRRSGVRPFGNEP